MTIDCIHIRPTMSEETYFDLLDKESLARIAFNIRECSDFRSFVGFGPPNECLNYRDAIKNGHMTCFRTLIDNQGLTKVQYTRGLEIAAKNGRIEILQYLKDINPDLFRACSVCDCYCLLAIKGGRLECLRWLVDNGFCLKHEGGGVVHGSDESVHGSKCFIWKSPNRLNRYLISSRNLECVKFVNERTDIRWDVGSTPDIIRSDDLDFIKGLYAMGYIRSSNLTKHAAMLGHLELLKWLHETGCPWGYGTIRDARIAGETECLEYALANGCSN
jgi:hypothetical protein